MHNGPSPSDETTVSHEDVVVTRRLTSKAGGLVGTIELRPTGRNPVVLAHVVDELPADLPIEAVGFEPDMSPEEGCITPQRLSIKQTVEADPVQIEYGIRLTEPVEPDQFDPPTIRAVETAEITRSTGPATDGGEPAGASPDGTDGSSRSFTSILPGFGRGSAGGEGQTDQQAADTDSAAPAAEPAATEASDTAETSADTIEQAVEWADEPRDDDGATTETEAASGEQPQADRMPATTDGGEAGAESPTPGGAEPPIDGEMPTTDPRGAAEGMDRRSVEVRLDRLSARIEEFAAYTAALEDLIDEHGTAAEFVDRMERDLAALEGRVESIHQTVEAVRDTHGEDVDALQEQTDALDQRITSARRALETDVEEVRDRVDTVDDAVDRVESDLDHIETDLAEQGTTVGRIDDDVVALEKRVTGVENDIEEVRTTVRTVADDISTVAEDVDDMQAELTALRATVEELTEFKESLAHAFDGPAGGTAPGDD